MQVPCVKVPITAGHQRHAQSQDRGSSRQGAATRHTVHHCVQGSLLTPHFTQHRIPTRRPYTTSRPQFTQKHNSNDPNVVQSTMNRPQLDRHSQSTFRLVFQVRIPIPRRCTDFSHKIAMRRRNSQNCDETRTAGGHDATNTIKHTGSRVPH